MNQSITPSQFKEMGITVSIIVAMADNHVIGKDGTMPWSLPADLAHFKKLTMGKPIIMGRKTFESIGRALPGRLNIVLTRNTNWTAPDGVVVVGSVGAALAAANGRGSKEVMVIGGAAVYTEFIPYTDTIYTTSIEAVLEGDTYFPNIFTYAAWDLRIIGFHLPDGKNEYAMVFSRHERLTNFYPNPE